MSSFVGVHFRRLPNIFLFGHEFVCGGSLPSSFMYIFVLASESVHVRGHVHGIAWCGLVNHTDCRLALVR